MQDNRPTSALSRILELIAVEPSITASELARRIGVSRERIRQLRVKHGLNIAAHLEVREVSHKRGGWGHPRQCVWSVEPDQHSEGQ